MLKDIASFITGSARIAFKGGTLFYGWISILALVSLSGLVAWLNQAQHGLIITNMRDQVSWAFNIGNFTFLVGVAAAELMLAIPILQKSAPGKHG